MQVNSEKKALLDPSEKSTVDKSVRAPESQAEGAGKKVGKSQMPKKATEDEFAKGPLGFLSTLAYLSMVWIVGLSFATGMLFLNMARLGNEPFPVYFGADSFIGNVPSIVYEPNPAGYNSSNKGVILFTRNQFLEEATHDLLVRYWELIQDYNVTTYYNVTEDDRVVGTEKRKKCLDFDGNQNGKPVNNSCLHEIDSDDYGPCALTEENLKQNAMGLADGRPCIMMRLAKLIGWFPDVPEVSKNSTRSCKKNTGRCCHRHRVTFNCTGAKYDMYPKDGIHTCGYPFWNQQGFQAPFVMLKFNLTVGKTEVTCKHNLKLEEGDEDKNNVVINFEMN